MICPTLWSKDQSSFPCKRMIHDALVYSFSNLIIVFSTPVIGYFACPQYTSCNTSLRFSSFANALMGKGSWSLQGLNLECLPCIVQYLPPRLINYINEYQETKSGARLNVKSRCANHQWKISRQHVQGEGSREMLWERDI